MRVRLLPKIFPRDTSQRAQDVERSLVRMEAKIGGELFGPVEKGQTKTISTRYDIRPTGVLKSQNGQSYQRLTLDEARNLYRAAELYRHRVGTEYQRMMQLAA
jgi:hypothetical protein